MAQPTPPDHSLRKLFKTLMERCFLERLGWPDWHIVDYLSDLMIGCIHTDGLYAARDRGTRLIELIHMIKESEHRAFHETRERERDIHRQIGDYTLFMSGLFPEGVKKGDRLALGQSGGLLDYVKVGKRSYRMVADADLETQLQAMVGPTPGSLYRRLSVHFELCVEGLGYVRQELQGLQSAPHDPLRRLLLN